MNASAMSAAEYSQKVTELTNQFKNQMTNVATSKMSAEEKSRQLANLNSDLQKQLAALQSQLGAAPAQPAQTPPAGGVQAFVTSPTGAVHSFHYRTTAIDELAQAAFLKSPLTQSFDQWALASEHLFKSGQRKRALFCWYVFGFLGLAQAHYDENVIGYMYGMRSRFGNSIIEWVSPDLDLWNDVFDSAIHFAATKDWQNSLPGIDAKAWSAAVKQETLAQQTSMREKLFGAQARSKILADRKSNHLPIGKITDGLGEDLPATWR